MQIMILLLLLLLWLEESIWDRYKDVYTQDIAKEELDRSIQLTDFAKKEIALIDNITEASKIGDGKKLEEARGMICKTNCILIRICGHLKTSLEYTIGGTLTA